MNRPPYLEINGIQLTSSDVFVQKGTTAVQGKIVKYEPPFVDVETIDGNKLRFHENQLGATEAWWSMFYEQPPYDEQSHPPILDRNWWVPK